MATIKERAIEKYCTHCGARVEYNCSAMDTPCNSIKNYIKIATEQKAIDIDKAWDYFKGMIESWCLEVGADPNVYLPQEEDKYRKAMEE